MARRSVPSVVRSVGYGGECCVGAAKAITCRGPACGRCSIPGFLPLVSATLIHSCAWASSPEVGAGCGNAARPDLWRGWSEMIISTPTLIKVKIGPTLSVRYLIGGRKSLVPEIDYRQFPC